MTKIFTALFFVALSFVQCDEPDPTVLPVDDCPNARDYTMVDSSDLAGCSWMLVNGDSAYEVINLGDYFDTFGEDVAVTVELKLRPDLASACQAGMITEIVCKP